MANILQAIEAQKASSCVSCGCGPWGTSKACTFIPSEIRLRNGSGPQLIQEFLAVSAAAAEVAG
jgi:hypothetical protein